MMTQTVICMKWGTRYGPDYVNRLYSMVQRQTARQTRFVCYTDTTQGLDPGVETFPLPPIKLPPSKLRSTWRKLCIWQKDLEGVTGEALFIDLDMVITGNLDGFFDYKPGHFCVARNWSQPRSKIGNTSIFRFPVGGHTYLFDRIENEPDRIFSQYRTEQAFISLEIGDMHFWPDRWCASFKHSLLPAWPLNLFMAPALPAETKIVAFTGKPDPDEAMEGRWPRNRWYQVLYKHVRPAPWIAENWR